MVVICEPPLATYQYRRLAWKDDVASAIQAEVSITSRPL